MSDLVTVSISDGIAAQPLAVAFDIARAIAARSPHAVQAAKRLLNEAWRADARTGLGREEELQLALLGSPNQIEAVNAALHKRAAKFAAVGGVA